jgi:hypothetical protein
MRFRFLPLLIVLAVAFPSVRASGPMICSYSLSMTVDAGKPLTIYVSSYGDAPIVQDHFVFGDGLGTQFAPTTQPPLGYFCTVGSYTIYYGSTSHIYTSPGTYSLEIISVDSNGLMIAVFPTITVLPASGGGGGMPSRHIW